MLRLPSVKNKVRQTLTTDLSNWRNPLAQTTTTRGTATFHIWSGTRAPPTRDKGDPNPPGVSDCVCEKSFPPLSVL